MNTAALPRSLRGRCQVDVILTVDSKAANTALDNHSMGTVFEELVRKFNDENNEEAGEPLFLDFDLVRAALEKRLTEWGNVDEEETEDDEAPKRPAIPEKRRKKLLDAATWKRLSTR